MARVAAHAAGGPSEVLRMGPPAHVSVDPALLSPADRARAVATLLATGLLRLSANSGPAEPAEFRTNDLAVRAAKSVTVHAG